MPSPRFFSVKSDVAQCAGNFVAQCDLCPRRCTIPPGEKGLCQVRFFNKDGKPEIPFYGYITGMAIDPIEKKPLYHFRPGSKIFSVGFKGCNLRCPFCQNWRISQNTDADGSFCSAAELIAAVTKNAANRQQSPAAKHSLAYTYSEPLVHFEFLLDCMKEGRKAGIANVLVSNGCINAEAAEEILEYTDAANIDLKCFSGDTYSKILGGDLSTVLAFIKTACEKDVHIELTTLVVPGLNDSEEELDACVDFIADLKKENGKSTIPWHLSAYHPDWKWKAPPTSPRFMSAAAERARKRLAYVYTGNIAPEKNDTPCPHCGKILISRRGYNVDTSGLSLLSLKEEKGQSFYSCVSCGKEVPVIA